MEFAQYLKSAMDSKSVTMYRLAKELGVHQTTIKNWLDGKGEPRISEVHAIAAALGISVLDLLGKNTPENQRIWEQEARQTGKSVAEIKRETTEDMLEQEATDRLLAALEASDPAIIQVFSDIPDDDIMVHLNSIIVDDLTRSGRILTLKRAYELSLMEGYGRFPLRTTPQSTPASTEGKDTTPPPGAPETPPEGE